MGNPAIDIPNLLFRYADMIDAGDFAGAARLFRHGCVIAEGHRIEGEEAIAEMWRGWVRLYEDGTPRTRHIVTNPIIEIDEDGEHATCQSQWTVLQATGVLPLQPIATGRYHDRLARIEGEWQFIERAYARTDLIGDTSGHTLKPMKSGDN